MKKLTVFGLVFLALALIASPAIAKELPISGNDAVGSFNFKMAIADGQPGDNIGFCIRGASKDVKEVMDVEDRVAEAHRFKAGSDLSHHVKSAAAGGKGKDQGLAALRAFNDEAKNAVAGEPGNNIDVCIREISKEELKSLIDGGNNVCMLTRSISKNELNGADIGGRKIVVNKISGEENSIPVSDSLNRHALDAFIHSTTKSKLNGDEIGGRKYPTNRMLVVGNGPGANGEQNCIPVLSNRIMHGADTNVEEIELAVEKIERT